MAAINRLDALNIPQDAMAKSQLRQALESKQLTRVEKPQEMNRLYLKPNAHLEAMGIGRHYDTMA